MDFTDFLAVWGALLATLSIIWNVVRDLRDRADVRLSAMIGYLVEPPPIGRPLTFRAAVEKKDATHLMVSITNHGRRSVLITKLFFQHEGDSGMYAALAQTLPRMLRENEFTVEYTNELDVLRHKLKRVYAVDSTGREWDLEKTLLDKLRQRVVELGL